MAPTLEVQASSTKSTTPIFRIPIWLIRHDFKCLDNSFLQGEEKSTFLVEAESGVQAVEALTKYPGYNGNYNNLKREQRRKVQPFKLRKGEVERMPDCARRHKNKNKEYTCGTPVHAIEDHPDRDDEGINLNGEFGMCCLEGYDSPEDCPIKNL